MSLTIEEAVARVPFLAGKKVRITQLSGGITNLNYKIETANGAYVIRITGADTDKLGIKRDVEYAANLTAGLLGVGSEVVYYIEPEDYLVTKFITGRVIPPEEMRQSATLKRVADNIRTFHESGPVLKNSFNVFRRLEMLTDVSREHNCVFPEDFPWICRKIREAETALKKVPYVPAPCHDDLLNLNFLEENGRLRILDWEYAGMGDIFFDLANFSHHHALSDEQMQEFLKDYFGYVTPQFFARIKLMYPMSELHEALWGVTPSGISKLKEDFVGYANMWFERARVVMNDPRWDSWLEEVCAGELVSA